MIKFVQIGAHIGQNDFASTITKTSEIEFGLLIEPLPHLIPKLIDSYKNISNIIIENKAITIDDSEELIFYYDIGDPITELSSLNRQHLIDHKVIEENIKEIVVKTEKLENILYRYNIKDLDWLFIDIEGLDCDLLLSLNLSDFNIKNIVFEFTHSDGAFSRGGPKLSKVYEKMNSYNYEISNLDGYNLLCKLK